MRSDTPSTSTTSVAGGSYDDNASLSSRHADDLLSSEDEQIQHARRKGVARGPEAIEEDEEEEGLSTDVLGGSELDVVALGTEGDGAELQRSFRSALGL